MFGGYTDILQYNYGSEASNGQVSSDLAFGFYHTQWFHFVMLAQQADATISAICADYTCHLRQMIWQNRAKNLKQVNFFSSCMKRTRKAIVLIPDSSLSENWCSPNVSQWLYQNLKMKLDWLSVSRLMEMTTATVPYLLNISPNTIPQIHGINRLPVNRTSYS